MMGGVFPERITFAGEEFDLKWDSVFVQVALVGAVCFCEPGLYNAIVSMAGGIVSLPGPPPSRISLCLVPQPTSHKSGPRAASLSDRTLAAAVTHAGQPGARGHLEHDHLPHLLAQLDPRARHHQQDRRPLGTHVRHRRLLVLCQQPLLLQHRPGGILVSPQASCLCV